MEMYRRKISYCKRLFQEKLINKFNIKIKLIIINYVNQNNIIYITIFLFFLLLYFINKYWHA